MKPLDNDERQKACAAAIMGLHNFAHAEGAEDWEAVMKEGGSDERAEEFFRVEAYQCPFCLSLQLGLVPGPWGDFRVRCFKCNARGPEKTDPALALVAWNRAWEMAMRRKAKGVFAKAFRLYRTKLNPYKGVTQRRHPVTASDFDAAQEGLRRVHDQWAASGCLPKWEEDDEPAGDRE